MRDTLKRILMLLASANVSTQELDRFLRFARESPRNVLEDYRFLLRELDRFEGNGISRRAYSDNELQLFESTLRDVNYVLQNAGLPRGLAARQIAKELASMGAVSSERSIRFTPKDGFESWLRRIYNQVGGSAVLRATTIVADRYLKRPRSDWPLTSS